MRNFDEHSYVVKWVLPAVLAAATLPAVVLYAAPKPRASAPSDPRAYIVSIAGTGQTGLSPDGVPAATAQVWTPTSVAIDTEGNIYVADGNVHRVKRIDARSGLFVTIAGNGDRGTSGDGGPAVKAQLDGPTGLVLDGKGALYISDVMADRVRKVDLHTGVIVTVAGGGVANEVGDGKAATQATLKGPTDVALDGAGNLYIAENQRIRKVAGNTGTITTIASGLTYPRGIAVSTTGEVYFTEPDHNRIREVDAKTGQVKTFSGTDTAGSTGDGGPASAATWNTPKGLAFDAAGNLYVVDSGNGRIRMVRPDGMVGTIIGGGGTSPTAGPARSLEMSLDRPEGLTIASDGTIIVAELARILRTSAHATQAPPAVAKQTGGAPAADAAAVDSFRFVAPTHYKDPISGVWGSDDALFAITEHGAILRSTDNGAKFSRQDSGAKSLSAISGSGKDLWVGSDGVLLASANDGKSWRRLAAPSKERLVALRATSPTDLWIAAGLEIFHSTDGGKSFALRQKFTVHSDPWVEVLPIDASNALAWGDFNKDFWVTRDGGRTWTLTPSPLPDHGDYEYPEGSATLGNVVVLVSQHGVARTQDAGQTWASPPAVTLEAPFALVDGGSRIVSAAFSSQIVATSDGGRTWSRQKLETIPGYDERAKATSLWVSADQSRVISGRSDGVLLLRGTPKREWMLSAVTDGGTGHCGKPPDLRGANGLAVDREGNLFIADTAANVIREVAHGSCEVTIVAGTGSAGSSGDNGPAIAATLDQPYGIAVNSGYHTQGSARVLQDTVYVTEQAGRRVRSFEPGGNITTIAGTGAVGHDGDRGDARRATFGNLTGIALDLSTLYVADNGSEGEESRLRSIDVAAGHNGTITTVQASMHYGAYGFLAVSVGPGMNNNVLATRHGEVLAELTYSEHAPPQMSQHVYVPLANSGIAAYYDEEGFVATEQPTAIQRFDPAHGDMKIIAGAGTGAYKGHPVPALQVGLGTIKGVALYRTHQKIGAGEVFLGDEIFFADSSGVWKLSPVVPPELRP